MHLALIAVTAALHGAAAEPVELPALRRAPRVDGDLSDWRGGGVSLLGSQWSRIGRVEAGHARGTLYLAVDVRAPVSGAGVTVSLAFRGAGPLATGYYWGFGADGRRRAPQTLGGLAPSAPHALDAASASGREREGGYTLEIALAARALPRFPTKAPWIADLCFFIERSHPGSCFSAAVQMPSSLTVGALPSRPPASVLAVESRRGGWIGFGEGASPAWIAADQPLDQVRLRELLGSEAASTDSAGINVPDRLFLPGRAPLVAAVVGTNPFGPDGKCEPGRALRLLLYRVTAKGRTADRVLDWAAADCALGRLRSVQLDEEGELTLGYTGGATALFMWSKDHFERIEIGSR